MRQDGDAVKDGSSPAGSPVFQLYSSDGRSGWLLSTETDPLKLHSAGLVSQLEQYTAEGRHRKLVDFEDHMDDISLDWLNLELVPAQ